MTLRDYAWKYLEGKKPMSTSVTLKHEWDMGHRLSLHNGKCARLHGHRYVCEVDVEGNLRTNGPATGMVIDFYDLKQVLKSVIDDHWDHRTMLWEGDRIFGIIEDAIAENGGNVGGNDPALHGIFSVPFHPTAENIAKELLRVFSGYFQQGDTYITRVRVYETPNGWAEAKP